MMSFSPTGLVVILAVMLPNLAWMLFPPAALGADPMPSIRSPLPLAALEALGRVGCFSIPLFVPFGLATLLARTALSLMTAALLIYYAGWARYFAGGRRSRLLLVPMLGLAVPMAVTPVAYFALAAVAGRSWPLGASAVALGIGHISITYTTYRLHTMEHPCPPPHIG